MGRLWNYVQNGKAQGPVPAEQISSMLAAGILRSTDLVWSEGLVDWTAIQSIPELAPLPTIAPIPPPPSTVSPVVSNPYVAPQAQVGGVNDTKYAQVGQVSERAIEYLLRTRPWVRFIAILGIILMAIMVLGGLAMAVFGGGFFSYMGVAARIGMGALYMVLALLYLPPVIFLNRFANRITDVADDHSPASLEEALRAQKAFWKYVGMFALITMCIYALALVGILGTGLAMGRLF